MSHQAFFFCSGVKARGRIERPTTWEKNKCDRRYWESYLTSGFIIYKCFTCRDATVKPSKRIWHPVFKDNTRSIWYVLQDICFHAGGLVLSRHVSLRWILSLSISYSSSQCFSSETSHDANTCYYLRQGGLCLCQRFFSFCLFVNHQSCLQNHVMSRPQDCGPLFHHADGLFKEKKKVNHCFGLQRLSGAARVSHTLRLYSFHI